MGMSDVALQALLNYQAERARQPLPSELAAPGIMQALSTLSASREQALKEQELVAKYGTPASGTPGVVTVGAPPADPRRRFLGIPFGRAPRVVQVLPDMAGDAGGASLADIPPELITGPVRDASRQGQAVYYRPASPDYRPASIGTDELKARADLLPYVQPGNVEDLLTQPDRAQAFRGARPKLKVGTVTIDDGLRQKSIDRYGYDVFEGMPASMSDAAVSRLLTSAETTLRAQSRPSASKEGDQLMDAATVKQLYMDEGLTPDEIKKAPKQLKARDYRARRGRLNAKARGNILDVLLGGKAAGGTNDPGDAAGDAVMAKNGI